jgi:hypothetical protein
MVGGADLGRAGDRRSDAPVLGVGRSGSTGYLRHGWASWHVMSGTSLRELMDLGGWKSYEMVLRSANLAPEHLSQAAGRIERVWEVVEKNPTIFLR